MRRGLDLWKAAASLTTLVFLLALSPGAALPQAGAQETTSREQTVSEAEVPRPPEVAAQAWALVDADSGLYLAGENPDKRLPVASITKIMVALVALEEDVNLDEEVVISAQAERFVGNVYSNVGLIKGERVSVRDLLLAALVPSGTEAVHALAEHLGGGSVEDFVEKMNQRAASMGLENTSFQNPAGLEDPRHYSSARDIAQITHEALGHSLFAEMVGATEATINTQNREIEVFTTNQLLHTYPPATGVKTGTSPRAGPSLVASAEAGDESYVAVVLGAADDTERFRAAEELLRHGFDRYERRTLVREGEAYGEKTLPYRREETVQLVATRDVSAPVDASSEMERRVKVGRLPPRADKGDRLGEVEVLVGGQSVGKSPLVARTGYEEASIPDRIWYWITRLFR